MSLSTELHSQLIVLKRQYFQQVEPSQLRWLDDRVLKQVHVQSWIFEHLFNSDHINYPPPEGYQQRVLKLLISILERSIVDPEEDVRYHYCSYAQWLMHLHQASAQSRYCHYHCGF